MSLDPRTLRIPRDLLPEDGRFGSGPSRVRDAQVDALASRAGRALLGTSHRQAPVRALVGRLRSGVATLFSLPPGYEVALGVGGSTLFWDLAAYSLVERRSAHAVHGEFSAKFAQAARAPHLSAPLVVEAAPGSRAELDAVARGSDASSVDVWALVQNETSTGVAAPVRRPRLASGAAAAGLTIVDATSAAGCVAWDPLEADTYYFSPQKGIGADGGLWIAALSPAAIERAERLAAERYIPAVLSLAAAVKESRKDQTLNTPAIATLLLAAEQIDWLNASGGLTWAAARSAESSGRLYAWAESRPWASPFVEDPTIRSKSVVTIDLDAKIDAALLRDILRSNGIVDVDPYRSLKRNGLRIGTFPSVEPEDVSALIACVDWVVERL
ncbi:MAG: phosphoserine transaminase [Candidatus Nanopelagicales bacterium]